MPKPESRSRTSFSWRDLVRSAYQQFTVTFNGSADTSHIPSRTTGSTTDIASPSESHELVRRFTDFSADLHRTLVPKKWTCW